MDKMKKTTTKTWRQHYGIISEIFLALELISLEYGRQILTPKTVAFTYDRCNA
jgi:hypothetical protein